MKKIFLSLIAISTYTLVFAQARVTVSEYQKTQQPAVENEIKFPESTVSDAIKNKLEKMGYKGKDTKGYVTYRSVRIAELGPETYDLYFKTARKSKKEKDISVITLMITKGNENFVSEVNDATLIGNAKKFLENLQPDVEAQDLFLQITEQESIVKKANKKMEDLAEEREDLLKKQKKIEEQIADNLKAQEAQKGETATQTQILDTLKAKKKQ